MVLQLVNLELATGHAHEAMAQQDLNTYLGAFRLLGARHDTTGLAVQITTKCLQYFRSMRQASSPDFTSPSTGRNWTDISICQPTAYLRLVAWLDLSISYGRPAQASELHEYLPLGTDVDTVTEKSFVDTEYHLPAIFDDPDLFSDLQSTEMDGLLSHWDDQQC